MDEELQALFDSGACELVEREDVKKLGKPIVKSTWAFCKKRRASGEVFRYNSRYCVRRLLFTLGLVEGWSTASIDFKNAFTQASLPEPLFLELPPGYLQANLDHTSKVIRVNTSLYGDVRAANLWYHKIADSLTKDMGFSLSEHDPCLFIRDDCIMALYVDDAILLSRDDASLEKVLQELKSRDYNFNRDGNFNINLGIRIDRQDNGSVKLSQPHLCRSF